MLSKGLCAVLDNFVASIIDRDDSKPVISQHVDPRQSRIFLIDIESTCLIDRYRLVEALDIVGGNFQDFGKNDIGHFNRNYQSAVWPHKKSRLPTYRCIDGFFP